MCEKVLKQIPRTKHAQNKKQRKKQKIGKGVG